jgi:hypothetical protein
VTWKPSIAACRAQIGSISVTMTRAPWPRSDSARALADVAVAADDGDLAADQDVGGAVDAVDRASGGSRTCCRTCDLVTESLTLIAGNSSVAGRAASGRGGGHRWSSPR